MWQSPDTRPPMLDRTDFASWQQRIRLYCWEGNEGALHLGPERPRVYSDMSPEDKESRQNRGSWEQCTGDSVAMVMGSTEQSWWTRQRYILRMWNDKTVKDLATQC
ncbi:hypothetical protein Tco_0038822 [Tanacetum coccineum]